METKERQMEIKTVTPEEMEKRVARFKTLRYPPDRSPTVSFPVTNDATI